jgi:hypothetical protein
MANGHKVIAEVVNSLAATEPVSYNRILDLDMRLRELGDLMDPRPSNLGNPDTILASYPAISLGAFLTYPCFRSLSASSQRCFICTEPTSLTRSRIPCLIL